MIIKADHVLSKTAKGIDAMRSGAGLSDPAKALLKLVDGRKSVAVLNTVVTAAGMSGADFQAAVSQLQQGGLVQNIERPVEAQSGSLNAEVEKQMLVTLDFTSEFVEHKQRAMGISGSTPEKQDTAAVEAAAKAQAEERARQAKAARMKLEADIRQKLAAALRPQIEEELRGKLRAKLEQELRPQLVAALRPGIEAEVRTQLQKELTPRVELELKTRLARSMASQLNSTIPPAPKAEALPKVVVEDAASKRFERTLASLSDPVFTVDKSLKCTYLSAAWAQLSGIAAADAIGRSFVELFEDSDRRGLEKMLNGVCDRTALRFDFQACLTRKDAPPLWVELKTAPQYATDGGIEGVCGTLRDVTELRRAAEDMELAGVRLLLLIDQIDTGVLLEDRDGRIQQVNPAFCALLSVDAAPYSLEGLETRDLLQQIAGVFIDREGFERRMAEIQKAGDDVKGEVIMLADGRVIEQDYLEVSADSTDGGNSGHIWLFREMRRGR